MFEQLEPEEPTVSSDKNSPIHKNVLLSLEEVSGRIPGFSMEIEKCGNRLDLPNEWFARKAKPPRQREKSLCHTDAVLCTSGTRTPRILIEVVDSSPTSPNGITGLTVNADRIAGYYKEQGRIDLLFIVLSELKRFYCERHVPACPMKEASGHKFWEKQGKGRALNAGVLGCFEQYLPLAEVRNVPIEVIIEGSARQYRKALVTYPIKDYLRYMSADPWVLFLNATKIQDQWSLYKIRAEDLVQRALREILDGAAPLPWNVDELVPDEVWQALGK